jgi:hypothetical protein
MPWKAYGQMTDTELKALWAYLRQYRQWKEIIETWLRGSWRELVLQPRTHAKTTLREVEMVILHDQRLVTKSSSESAV